MQLEPAPLGLGDGIMGGLKKAYGCFIPFSRSTFLVLKKYVMGRLGGLVR